MLNFEMDLESRNPLH